MLQFPKILPLCERSNNMKIAFEKWLNENDIPEEAMSLFEESIHCYKVSAYRSAFIMSYIAFQNILKKRMLSTVNIPTGVTTTWWTNICTDLGNEDKWDSIVADCVKRNNPDRVFLITSATVSEYEAFRVIRNKCAHGKAGKIDYYHIESLWNFIEENFYKFVINGGKAGVLVEIQNHYDKTITPPGTDISYIINHIKLGILDSDLDQLIKDIYDFCVQSSSNFRGPFSKDNPQIDLWDKLVNESNERIQNKIIEFIINEKEEKVCDFVGRYPSTADKFLSNDAFARKLWTGLIKDLRYDRDGFWIMIDRIVSNNIVPSNEKDDFNKLLFASIGKCFPEEKLNLLERINYFEILRKHLFDSSKYEYPNGINHANSNCNAFVHYINVFGLDKDSVMCINHIFSFASYGPFFDAIKNIMKKDEMLSTYQKIVNEQGWNDYAESFKSTNE